MTLAHLADCHIGYRRASDPDRCEADVAATFARVIDRVIEVAPDVLVIGGDVFHQARPTNNAILAAIAGFSKLTRALPDTPVVIAAGNHDLSKDAGAACILRVLEPLGVHIADRQAKRFYFPDRDLSVLAVPDAPGVSRPSIVPDARARLNVCVLHGEVSGMLPAWQSTGERAALEITRDELAPAAWDFVALGHYHIAKEIAPNCFYSGSIDYTSSNPWEEISTPKGFIERDLETGAHTFHAVEPTRRYVDLAPIDAHGMGASDLDAAIQVAAASQDLAGCVVRLVVHGVTPEIGRALDQKSLKAIKRPALTFRLDLRRPDREKRAPIAASYAELRQRSLRDILVERLGARALASDVDREQLATLALGYFDQSEDKIETRAVEPIPVAEPCAESVMTQQLCYLEGLVPKSETIE